MPRGAVATEQPLPNLLGARFWNRTIVDFDSEETLFIEIANDISSLRREERRSGVKTPLLFELSLLRSLLPALGPFKKKPQRHIEERRILFSFDRFGRETGRRPDRQMDEKKERSQPNEHKLSRIRKADEIGTGTQSAEEYSNGVLEKNGG